MSPRRIAVVGLAWGCLALGSLAARAGDEAASRQLPLENLQASDESVRLQAIDQLGSLGAKAAEAVPPLVKLLQDNSAAVRAHAACSLGKIGEAAKPTVAALADLLKDPDPTVRRQALKAIIKIRPGPQVSIPLCVRLLDDSDPGMRMRILNAISEAGPAVVPGLIAGLKNDKTAYWACLALRDIGPAAKDALPELMNKLQDPRPEIRREAILAIAAMDTEAAPAADAIAKVLDENDEATRVAATYALGRIGSLPDGVEAVLRKNAQSDDPMLSTTSLWALARAYPEDKPLRTEATRRLIERLKDADPLVRVAAARALSSLPPAPEITLPLWEKALAEADETTVLHALDALASLGPTAVPRLVEALRYEKAQRPVIYVLGRIGPDAAPATPALAKLIGDKNSQTAKEAILALANIGPGAKQAVPALLEALQQKSNPNAHAIIYALGNIGPDAAAAIPMLQKMLLSSDRNLAMLSAWALANIDPNSVELSAEILPVLIVGLTDRSPLVRAGASDALGQLGTKAGEALPALQKAMNDDDKSVRDAAAKAVHLIRGKGSDNGK